jgi:predicted lipid carrier protein YhbT
VVREGARELDVSVTPGASDRSAEAAACTLRVDAADLEAVRNGTSDPLQLFFQGKIGIEGDAQIAMMLGSAFMA